MWFKVKKIISITLIAVFVINICLFNTYAEELTYPDNSDLDMFDFDMTMDEYRELTFEEREILIAEAYERIFPQDENANARYKSGENDPTHQTITAQAVDAFINDKGFYTANSTTSVTHVLALVVFSAAPDSITDESYRASNSDHFYLPETGKGLLGAQRSAADAFEEYYNKALEQVQNNNITTALKHLGRALHYVQDVTVPHHTESALTVAHANYEAFCYDNIEEYIGDITTVDTSSYNTVLSQDCSSIIASTARVSNLYYDYVHYSGDTTYWDTVASRQTVVAVKKTAAVLYKFSVDASLTLYDV